MSHGSHNSNFLTDVLIARRREDLGSHRAYVRPPFFILINKVKKKCCECALSQFSDYLSKNSWIFVLKLRRFHERVTETGREFQMLGPW